jgi:hypothetical protein
MTPVSGDDARITRSNPTRFEEGVFALTGELQRMLTSAFFFGRLSSDLASGKTTGTDREQVRFCRNACYDLYVLGLNKLLDKTRGTWNFQVLLREFKQHATSSEETESVSEAVSSLEKKMASFREHRHLRIAHRSERVRMNEIVAPAQSIPFLAELVALMDMFTTSPIPYRLYLHDTGETIELRSRLGLK